MLKQSTTVIGAFVLAGLGSLFLLNSCSTKATVQVWESEKESFNWPEQALNLPSTGVCFSGGGTRAMSCAIGQMKGLEQLGLWDDIGYVSAVSGGSWASTIFTYYNAGAANDSELLGTPIAPGDITWDDLENMPETFMGWAPTQSLTDDILENMLEDRISLGLLEAPDDIWIDAVGKAYLEHFGIYDRDKPRYFTLNDSTMQEIIARNVELQLTPDDFYVVHKLEQGDVNRPYLVINSSLVAPADLLPVAQPESLTVFNYTPLYCGSVFGQSIAYDSRIFGKKSHFVGGSFIEPFAFGLSSPKDNPTGDGSVKTAQVDWDKKKRFRLADATGTSSSAYAATIAGSLLMQLPTEVLIGTTGVQIIPEEKYWTVENGAVVKEKNYRFGDGGNLENYGLITLLQRDVKKVIVFINSETAINENYVPSASCPPNSTVVDPDFSGLFGYGSENQQNNTIFTFNDFIDIFNQFKQAKIDGKSVIAMSKGITIQANPWWGLKGGNTVDILWVYNEEVNNWEEQLSPALQDSICEGTNGPFSNFPLYATVHEYKGLVELSNPQVNLLYQLSNWNVATNAAMFDFIKQ